MLALIPVKPFDVVKQRLANILSPKERRQLSAAMLGDVVDALCKQTAIERIVVCSSDRQVASLARSFGVEFLDEDALNSHGLNAVVNAAARLLARQGVSELMVAHGDLPLLGPDELDHFVATHRSGSRVTVTPDTRRDGTNLLAWNPASRFEVQYGANSFSRHCHQCGVLGMAPTVCPLPGASRDIDNADDVAHLKTLPPSIGTRTAALLRQFDLHSPTPSPMTRQMTGALLA